MDNSVQRSKSNLNLHIKLNVNEPDFLICIIILTIISSMFLYFSPYLYLDVCTPLQFDGSIFETVLHI